jgi:hypothetical protein
LCTVAIYLSFPRQSRNVHAPAILPARAMRSSAFRSIVDLQATINRFVAEKPADSDKIIAAVKRGHQVLDSINRRSRFIWRTPNCSHDRRSRPSFSSSRKVSAVVPRKLGVSSSAADSLKIFPNLFTVRRPTKRCHKWYAHFLRAYDSSCRKRKHALSQCVGYGKS